MAAVCSRAGLPQHQLSAALHPSEADVPAEALLDPVANTLDLRAPFEASRAKGVLAAMDAARVGITDIASFDNLLHGDAPLRRKKQAFMLRTFDAAAALGVRAGCGVRGAGAGARRILDMIVSTGAAARTLFLVRPQARQRRELEGWRSENSTWR
jgi:sugar phosphate isomerase/epimerase